MIDINTFASRHIGPRNNDIEEIIDNTTAIITINLVLHKKFSNLLFDIFENKN